MTPYFFTFWGHQFEILVCCDLPAGLRLYSSLFFYFPLELDATNIGNNSEKVYT